MCSVSWREKSQLACLYLDLPGRGAFHTTQNTYRQAKAGRMVEGEPLYLDHNADFHKERKDERATLRETKRDTSGCNKTGGASTESNTRIEINERLCVCVLSRGGDRFQGFFSQSHPFPLPHPSHHLLPENQGSRPCTPEKGFSVSRSAGSLAERLSRLKRLFMLSCSDCVPNI